MGDVVMQLVNFGIQNTIVRTKTGLIWAWSRISCNTPYQISCNLVGVWVMMRCVDFEYMVVYVKLQLMNIIQ